MVSTSRGDLDGAQDCRSHCLGSDMNAEGDKWQVRGCRSTIYGCVRGQGLKNWERNAGRLAAADQHLDIEIRA
jgi:hypothetical protein